MKVVVVLGTRPEIIKMAPVVRVLEREAIDYFILHTGQHYRIIWIGFSLSNWSCLRLGIILMLVLVRMGSKLVRC